MTASSPLRPTASQVRPGRTCATASPRPVLKGTRDADAPEGIEKPKCVPDAEVSPDTDLSERTREVVDRLARAHQSSPILRRLLGDNR